MGFRFFSKKAAKETIQIQSDDTIENKKAETNREESTEGLKAGKVKTNREESTEDLNAGKVETNQKESAETLMTGKVETNQEESTEGLKDGKVKTNQKESAETLMTSKVETNQEESTEGFASSKIDITKEMESKDQEAISFSVSSKAMDDRKHLLSEIEKLLSKEAVEKMVSEDFMVSENFIDEFTMEDFTECERYILKNLSLMPERPMKEAYFSWIFCGIYRLSWDASLEHLKEMEMISHNKDGYFEISSQLKKAIQRQEKIEEFDLAILGKLGMASFYDEGDRELKALLAYQMVQFFWKKQECFTNLKNVAYEASKVFAKEQIEADKLEELLLFLKTFGGNELEIAYFSACCLYQKKQYEEAEALCDELLPKISDELSFKINGDFSFCLKRLYAVILTSQCTPEHMNVLKLQKGNEIFHTLYILPEKKVDQDEYYSFLVDYASCLINLGAFGELDPVLDEIETHMSQLGPVYTERFLDFMVVYYEKLETRKKEEEQKGEDHVMQVSGYKSELTKASTDYAKMAFDKQLEAYHFKRRYYGKYHYEVATCYHAIANGLFKRFADIKTNTKAFQYAVKAQIILNQLQISEEMSDVTNNRKLIDEILNRQNAKENGDMLEHVRNSLEKWKIGITI